MQSEISASYEPNQTKIEKMWQQKQTELVHWRILVISDTRQKQRPKQRANAELKQKRNHNPFWKSTEPLNYVTTTEVWCVFIYLYTLYVLYIFMWLFAIIHLVCIFLASIFFFVIRCFQSIQIELLSIASNIFFIPFFFYIRSVFNIHHQSLGQPFISIFESGEQPQHEVGFTIFFLSSLLPSGLQRQTLHLFVHSFIYLFCCRA